MRLGISTLATVVLMGLISTSDAGKATLSTPKHLYSFTLTLPEIHTIYGPVGQRVGAPITGGNMTSPDGKLMARLVPGIGGETGTIDKHNNLNVDARQFWQFVDDNKYALFMNLGIGPLGGVLFVHSRIETDSESRKSWNTYFVVNKITQPNPTTLMADGFYVSFRDFSVHVRS